MKTIKRSPVDGQPLVTLRQVSEALGYKGNVGCTNKKALVDMSIATLAIQPDQAQIVKRQENANYQPFDTSESILPTPLHDRWSIIRESLAHSN